jgi:hypothetical protein
LDEACAFPATRENVPKADLTLYPRITLVNEGLSFEKSDGGCYVNGFAGLEKELHVPVEVNGECVLGLKDGAVIGHVADDQSSSEVAPNVERIVFHGDATVEGNAVGGCLYLNEVVFMGDANLSEGAFMFSTAHLASRVRFVFYGKPTLNVAFFAYYLGISGNVSFEICVKTEYYNQALAAFGSVATVTVIG